MTKKLRKTIDQLDLKKANRDKYIPGELGLRIGGSEKVQVPNRPGYVYVRLRSNLSETIQAYNDTVSPVFGLPVVVIKDELDPTRYRVVERDLGRYQNWGISPFLPAHGNQHSFNPPTGGGDVVWVYSRQMLPLLVYPSGTAGAMVANIQPHTYYQSGMPKCAGGTGTASFVSFVPSNNQARMVLVYIDVDGNPQLTGGNLFDASITGTCGVVPHMPGLPTQQDIPLAGVRLVSGTKAIVWENIYDFRPWIVGDGNMSTGSPVTFASLTEAQAGASSTKVIAPSTLPFILNNGGLVRRDGTGAGGNARGDGAVDLQRDRLSADQVAGAEFSSVLGGASNLISVSGTYSIVAGGETNTILGLNHNTVLGGKSNYLSGTLYSLILGGLQNEVTRQYATAFGEGAKADYFGADVRSNVDPGTGAQQQHWKIQNLRLIWTVRTTNANMTEMFLDGTSEIPVLGNRVTWTFSILIAGKEIVNPPFSAGYKLEGVIHVGLGPSTTALVGSVTKTVLGESNAAWDCQATADTTTGYLKLEVQGEAGKNVEWIAIGEILEIHR